jgi:two-component system phosphate regulon sensor histidine kinase PhoR
MMYVAVPIEVNGKLVGAARVALPITQIEANIAHLRGTTLLATLIAGGLAILLSAVIAERTTRPLRQLTQAAQSISNGEPHKIHIQVPKDEVGQLVQAFNSMALQLRSQIEALKKESGKLGGVLNQMTDGVVIVDFQGAVQLLNPAAERMFNVREEASLGCSIAAALRHHQIVEVWRHCRETGETQVVALDLSHPRMALQCVATPLGQALPGSSLVLFQDLTRLRQLESVRRDFISNVSHELRTPLASLKALTETLQESALDDPPAARRFLQRMETEVDALSLMVSELLELSRIESGKVPLHFKSILPVNILQAAIERLKLQAERAGLAVNLDCAGNLPRVLADATRIEQVVVNLLHNAIKFTPQGGHIHLAAAQEDEAIIFSVQDSGVGIAPDDLPRIFERFYKADRARSGGGTGLGLAIARHLVEAHGGRIWAESTPGQGSTFYFSLPVAP